MPNRSPRASGASSITSAAAPITASQFAAAMAAFAPFEPRPHVAVAVSGGADSLAAALLTKAWASRRRGRVVALVVDHRLRPGSTVEALQVHRWLNEREIPAHVLTWRGARPGADMQAAARAVRYRLLLDWCAEYGILHLVLGHHRDDQAETFLLRLGRGSGLAGLAAMAACVERPAARLLRPLLGFPRARLHATLRTARQPWFEDPSNLDQRHARARLRAALPALGDDGLATERLAATAARLGAARAAVDAAVDDLLGAVAVVHPAGYVVLDPAPVMAAPRETALRALSRCVATVAGTEFGPRFDRLNRLYDRLGAPPTAGQTIGGCRVTRRPDGRVLFSREAAAIAPPIPLAALKTQWDGRFAVTMPRPNPHLTVAALGTGRRQLANHPGLAALPAPVRPVLPAIWRAGRVLAVPHVGFVRPRLHSATLDGLKVVFSPLNPLSAGRFTIV